MTDEDDYNGWLAAFKTLEVRSRVRGHIQSIHFKDGDIVTKGQLLFQLDPRPFQVEIDRATANARALDAQKIAAKKDLARYTELIKTGAASRQELDKAQADADAYDARIAALLEQIKRYELDLQYSKIAADLAGKIGKANLSRRQPRQRRWDRSGVGDNRLRRSDLRRLQRRRAGHAALPADRRWPAGQGRAKVAARAEDPVHFGLDTEKGFPHEGHLVFADNKYAEGTGTILVRGVAENPDGTLIPGSRVRVRIPVSDKYPATLVPDTAVNTDQDQKYLLVVGEDNVVKRHECPTSDACWTTACASFWSPS